MTRRLAAGWAGAVLLAAGITGAAERTGVVREKAPAELAAGVKAGGWKAALLLGGRVDAETCRALAGATERMKAFGLMGVLGGPNGLGDPGCGKVWGYGEIRDSAFLERARARAAGMAAVVVDGAGVVRFEARAGRTAEGVGELARELIRWEQGRASFAGHCGHCHGEDGRGTFYQGVRSMEGIALRMSDAEILDGGERFGAVPISTMGAEEVRNLLQFVRGL